jgi:hypothetical protein
VEEILTEQIIKAVSTRFELAAGRMVDAWLAAGRVDVSAADARLVREFLEESGWRVEEVTGGTVRVVQRDGRIEEMTREAAVMAALRQLAGRK